MKKDIDLQKYGCFCFGKICRFWACLHIFAKMTFLPPFEIFPKWNPKRPNMRNFDNILMVYDVKEALDTFISKFMALEIVIMEEIMCSGMIRLSGYPHPLQ